MDWDTAGQITYLDVKEFMRAKQLFRRPPVLGKKRTRNPDSSKLPARLVLHRGSASVPEALTMVKPRGSSKTAPKAIKINIVAFTLYGCFLNGNYAKLCELATSHSFTNART